MKNKITCLLGYLIFVFSSISLLAQAPVITQEPSPRGVIEGQTATFSVKVSGDTLTFQWYVNNIPIGSSNDSIYTTPPTTLLANGSEFKVIVTNTYGSDTSIAVKLYVTATGSRVIASQIVLYNFKEKTGSQVKDVSGFVNPLDLTINNTSFVDWSNNGLLVKGSALIKSSTSLPSQRINDAIRISNEMTLEMWVRPLTTITNAKLIKLSKADGNVNFEVENYNGYNFSVRTTTTNNYGIPGVVDGLPLAENLIHLVFTRSAEGDSKIYRNGGEVASSPIGGQLWQWVYQSQLSLGSNLNGSGPWNGIYYLTSLFDRALDSVEVAHNFSLGLSGTNSPFIIEQPKDTLIVEGNNTVFSVNVISDYPLSYKWQKNGVDIPGATDSFYVTPTVTLADSGSVFRIIVQNAFGADTSDNAILKVKFAPIVAPTNLSAIPSSTVINHVKLTWQDNSTNELAFVIERKTGDSASVAPFSAIDSVTANTTSFTDSTVSETTTYTYRVYAFNADTVSDYSNVASVTTPLFTIAAPSNLEAVLNPADTHFVKITWNDNSTNEIGFIIERKTGDTTSVDPFSVIDSVGADEVSFIDSAVVEFTTYTYRVNAFNLFLVSDYSNMASITTALFSVPAPTNLLAIMSPADTHNVKLTWVDNSPNEVGFGIERKTGDSLSSTPFVNIALVLADITFYEDTSVADTTTYTYRVYAFKISVVSNYSNLAQVITPIPVELTSFTANVLNGQVQLYWETATEINNTGFSIQRSKDNNKFMDIGFIKGKGTTTTQSSYSYSDKSVLSGKYYYRLKQVDFDGSANYLKSVEVDLGLPKDYALEQNYPNPFNPSTTIRFALPINAKVTITLYNALGQEVANIFDGELNAGIHETNFNASNLSSGVYFYMLKVQGANGSNFTSTKRMILMK